MHLVIYFCGTMEIGFSFSVEHAKYSKELQAHNTYTLVVNGCQHTEVCNNAISPNLDEFANRFLRTIFTVNDQGQTFLSRANSEELTQLGVGIQPDNYRWAVDRTINEYVQIKPVKDGVYIHCENLRFKGKEIDNSFKTNDEPIESITLVGYSRGAVTCFKVAQVKEELGITVPLRIVADQPVPGNFYPLPGTNAASIADCSTLKYVESVDLSIGAYTGNAENTGIVGAIRRFIHPLFFSQIIPKLPPNIDVNICVIPRAHHWDSFSGEKHIHMNLSRRLAEAGLLSRETANKKRNDVIDYYKLCSPSFPGSDEMQRIFGSNVAQLYRNVDKNYVKNLTQEQYEEFLCKWWKAQETEASVFSSQLTNELVTSLATINPEKSNQKLLGIVEKADEWLLVKAGLGSSRYQQVMNLRDNARERLLQNCENVEEMKGHLRNVSRQLKHSTHYFIRQWKKGSYEASWFKSDSTRELDMAFKEHDSAAAPSLENDEKLLTAIDKWLNAKQPISEGAASPSSRYELVKQIRAQLVKAIERYPQEEYTVLCI